jgi:hypothetical protein
VAKFNKETKDLRGQLDNTSKELGAATNDLMAAQAKAQEQQQRADKASTDLTSVTAERNAAQEELNRWHLFELTPDQIRTDLARLRTVERERDVFTTENQTMTREITRLKNELARYKGTDEPDIVLPPGTKGTVIAVDPKYDFVVLNIGGNQGVLENAKMLVARNGKLVGKVKITSVEPNRSIANVLPDWKQDENGVMEGDQVIF